VFVSLVVTIAPQGQAEKIAKNLESQLAELNAKLEQSSRELLDLNAFKSRAQSENADLARQLEEAEGNVSQLSRQKQTLSKQLDDTKAALEEESRIRAKITADNRNLQVAAVRHFHSVYISQSVNQSIYSFIKHCKITALVVAVSNSFIPFYL